MLLPLLVNGVFEGVAIALAGLGFAIIWYASKEFHFLYGTLLAASGYMLYSLFTNGVPLFLSVVVVLLFTAVFGAVLEHWFYRRLGSPLSVLLFSFGLAIILQNVLQIFYGPADITLPPTTLSLTSVPIIGSVSRQLYDLVALGALLLCWGSLVFMERRTDFGLALQAVMTDPETAQYVGVRPTRVRMYAYAIGSALGALAGCMSMIGSGVRPTFGFSVMLFAFMTTFLADGRLALVPVWGLGIGVALNLVAWRLPTNFNTLIIFTALLIYIVFKKRLHEAIARARVRVEATSEAAAG